MCSNNNDGDNATLRDVALHSPHDVTVRNHHDMTWLSSWKCRHLAINANKNKSNSSNNNDNSEHAATQQQQQQQVLPPWPVDEVEWNARLPDGGHGERRRHEAANDDNSTRRVASSSQSQCTAATTELVAHVSLADEVRTLPVGSIVNLRNRITRWRCLECCEMNSLKCGVCRFCARERFALQLRCPACGAGKQLCNKIMYEDDDSSSSSSTQVDNSKDNHHNTNKTTTATTAMMTAAEQSLSHTAFGAHNTFAPRAATLRCDACRALLHGARVMDVKGLYEQWWCACGACNNNALVTCHRCRLPRAVACTANTTSTSSSSSSSSSSSPQLLRRLLIDGAWDLRSCTSWLCANCEHVNRATHFVVALETVGEQRSRQRVAATRARGGDNGNVNGNSSSSDTQQAAPPPLPADATTATSSDDTTLVKVPRKLRGDPYCLHCAAPWHCQLLQEGRYWRCACHRINKRADVVCVTCNLPALAQMQVSTVSMWTRGDWYCVACRRHNYRSHIACVCGRTRSEAQAALATRVTA